MIKIAGFEQAFRQAMMSSGIKTAMAGASGEFGAAVKTLSDRESKGSKPSQPTLGWW